MCTKLNVCSKYQGKTKYLNMKLGQNKVDMN